MAKIAQYKRKLMDLSHRTLQVVILNFFPTFIRLYGDKSVKYRFLPQEKQTNGSNNSLKLKETNFLSEVGEEVSQDWVKKVKIS